MQVARESDVPTVARTRPLTSAYACFEVTSTAFTDST
jgi:hypothetical protein